MEKKRWLIDVEGFDSTKSVGFIAGKDADTVAVEVGGRQIVPVPEGERANPVYTWLAACGVEFITTQKWEDFPFYPVPQMAIFAVDGRGGCFATVGGIGDLEDDDYPVVYANGDGACFRLAPSLREFLRLICFCPGWRKCVDVLLTTASAHVQAVEYPPEAVLAEAGRKTAQLLGLAENPQSMQSLAECLEEGAGVMIYPSKEAAAAEYRFFEF